MSEQLGGIVLAVGGKFSIMERKGREEEKVSEDKYKPNMHLCHLKR